MTAALYRWRGELVGAWCLCMVLWARLPHAPRPDSVAAGGWPSLVVVAVGMSLRVWARRHAGAHTRGRTMAAPYRATGGPYRLVSHPLYTSNLLVLCGLAWRLWGNLPWAILATMTFPVFLYVLLARGESRLLRESDAPARSTPLDAKGSRWRSEWASLAPPLLAWVLAGW